jgi:hypothetical protein
MEKIKSAVHDAVGAKQKISTFHLQILLNANELQGLNAKAVCRELAVPESYATEFTKMLSLARLMEERGVRLS